MGVKCIYPCAAGWYFLGYTLCTRLGPVCWVFRLYKQKALTNCLFSYESSLVIQPIDIPSLPSFIKAKERVHDSSPAHEIPQSEYMRNH